MTTLRRVVRRVIWAVALLVALVSSASGPELRSASAAGVFTVTSPADAVDAAPGDGVCASASGVCTLRAAVQEANAFPGADTIVFAPALDGTPLTLVIAGAGEDAAARGDLDVRDALTVTGNGADATVVQACDAVASPSCRGIDRLFDVLDGASLTLNGLTVRNGYAADGAFSRVGGALRVGHRLPWEGGNGVASSLTLNRSRVLDSVASGDGGGITSIGALVIADSVVAGNAALGGRSGGGVANILGSRLTVARSTFSGNTAGYGGALYNNPGSLPATIHVSDSTISGNTATVGSGGGLFQNGSSDVRLSNTTVSGNRAATRGGGLYATGLILANATITGNTADYDGDGDGDGGGLFGAASVGNSVVAGNADGSPAPGVRHPDCSGPLASRGHNLIGDGAGCGGVANGVGGDVVGTTTVPLQAKLGPLADNGGPTRTHLPQPGSPAIDAGPPSGCTDAAGTASTTDQRGIGFPRAVDGDGDGVARCDRGAVEAPPAPADKTAPTVEPTVEGTLGAGGWYVSDVTVRWSVADFESTVESSQGCGTSSVTADTAGAAFTCRAISVGGTTSRTVVVKRDATAPAASPSASPSPNAAGWANADVTVTWRWSDALSGPGPACPASTTSTGEGALTLAASCTDAVGNAAAASHAVKVDKTPPAVAYTGNAVTYTVDQSVAIVCRASDALSGLAASTCADVKGPAYTFGLGTTTRSASATDRAGNAGAGSTSFTVVVTHASLGVLTDRFVHKEGVARSLRAKLRAADAAAARGLGRAEAALLRAYSREVLAQAGKALTADQAALLARLARGL